MTDRTEIPDKQEHPPALSGTRAAWSALGLLSLLITAWLFLNPLTCSLLKSGLTVASWVRGEQLQMGKLSLNKDRTLECQNIEWHHGPKEHQSSWKCDWIVIRPISLRKLIFPGKYERRVLIRELLMGNTKLLVDRRGEIRANAVKTPAVTEVVKAQAWIRNLLPASCTAGPLDLVVIGESYRVSINGLSVQLPERWAGKISFTEASIDVGSWHRTIPKGRTIALLEGEQLRFGSLDLGSELAIKELTLAPSNEGLEFGIKGTVGKGILRGDGVIGARENAWDLEGTLVGENLELEALAPFIRGEKQITGTINQARLTFRGDTVRPLEAASSLRLIAQDVQWEGRGWESLRIAATLTGRNLSVTELNLQQSANELTAEGRSKLPEDWHAVLRAPFTGSFSAQLEDAGALGALMGAEFSQLGGGLSLDGEVRGADNKAEGYCNVTGNGLRIRDLTLDWMKGCLLFEGESTRLSNLDAWSGTDRLSMQGTIANRRPHAYKATADVAVENLTKRLTQIGVATAQSMGAGAVHGTWQGKGSTEGNEGTFQASVKEWISPRTKGGMSGRFEGGYAKGRLDLTKAELLQDDLKLRFKLAATERKLTASDIVAVRGEKTKPLVEGSITLPGNAADFWQSGSILRKVSMTEPIAVDLGLHGIKAEELSELLGQTKQFTGALDGKLVVSGTLEKPVIHGALQINKWMMSGASSSRGLAFSFDTHKGRATAELVEEPSAKSPMRLHLEFPLQLANSKGVLQLVATAGPIQGKIEFHQAPLDGWMDLLGRKNWSMHGETVDGTIQITGAADKPRLDGDLTLQAGQAQLIGTYQLQQLIIPISMKGTMARLTNGTAAYRGMPLDLSGSYDWGGDEAALQLQLAGKNLPMELGRTKAHSSGTMLSSRGAATWTYSAKGTNTPNLNGSIQLSELTGSPVITVTPCFAPPGIQLNPTTTSITSQSPEVNDLKLDLVVKTDGLLDVRPAVGKAGPKNTLPAELPKLAINLHLQGAPLTPTLKGTLHANNWLVSLPAERFIMPEAIIQLEDGADSPKVAATAFGMTRRGLCALAINGSLAEADVGFTGPVNITAPDLLMALSMPLDLGTTNMTVIQGIAWNRQAQLFPLPSEGWMTSRLGRPEKGALGFYGAPWIWPVRLSAITVGEPVASTQSPHPPQQATNE